MNLSETIYEKISADKLHVSRPQKMIKQGYILLHSRNHKFQLSSCKQNFLDCKYDLNTRLDDIRQRLHNKNHSQSSLEWTLFIRSKHGC